MKQGRARRTCSTVKLGHTQLSCPFSPLLHLVGLPPPRPNFRWMGLSWQPMVKREGVLHGSCSNSPVMSFFCSTRGSSPLLLWVCPPAHQPVHPSITSPQHHTHSWSSPDASAPFNLRPAHRLHGQRWKDMLGKLLISNRAHTKLTDLIRWLPNL